MELGGISNSPIGARRVLKEYMAAACKGDVPIHFPFVAKRIAAAVLSFVPKLYLRAQKRRWQYEGC